MRDVLETTGLACREIHVLQTRGWDAYQQLLRAQERAKGRGSRARRGSRASKDLEAVVVVPEAEGEKEGQPEEAAAAAAAAPAAAPPSPAQLQLQAPAAAAEQPMTAAGDVEAPFVQRTVSEERDGVLHEATQMRCRQGRVCKTICSLLPRQPAAPAAAAALAAEPSGAAAAADGGSPPPSPRQGPLQAIAEEGQQLEPQPSPPLPSPPASPEPPQEQRRGIWRQLVSLHCIAGACAGTRISAT